MKTAVYPYVIFLYALAAPSITEARNHPVHKGDTYTSISKKTGIPVKELQACNPQARTLYAGREIKVSEHYTVKEGDSLSSVARATGTTLAELLDYNPRVKDADMIFPGQNIEYPCGRKLLEESLREDHDELEKKSTEKRRTPSRRTSSHSHVHYPSGLRLPVVYDENLTTVNKEFYDPNHSGNPLVRIKREDLAKKVSDHFVVAEFVRIPQPSLIPEQYRQQFAGDWYYRYARLDPNHVRRLEKLRAAVKGPLDITSGYRSNGYNDRLYRNSYGKKPTKSRHSSGDGVDVAVGYRRIHQHVERIFNPGGVGKGRTFTHVDSRGNRARWRY